VLLFSSAQLKKSTAADTTQPWTSVAMTASPPFDVLMSLRAAAGSMEIG